MFISCLAAFKVLFCLLGKTEPVSVGGSNDESDGCYGKKTLRLAHQKGDDFQSRNAARH